MYSFHLNVVFVERLVICVVFSEVYCQFFCFCGVEDEVISRAPIGQVLDLLPVGRLRSVCEGNVVTLKCN